MDTVVDMANAIKIQAKDVNVFYGENQALNNVSIDIEDRSVTAFIGPSGCGKSTFLRCFNRMNDVIPSCRVEGSIMMGDVDVNSPQTDPVLLRARIGMVFQKPNPFPKTIFENVVSDWYGHNISFTFVTQYFFSFIFISLFFFLSNFTNKVSHCLTNMRL